MHLFGKNLQDVLWFHEGFMEADEEKMRSQKSVEKRYAQAPVRTECILCGEKLNGPQRFSRSSVTFIFCTRCGHINGNHLISSEFVISSYTSESGQEVSGIYNDLFTSGKMAEEYWQVVERIYQPKAEFLRDFLRSCGLLESEVGVLDAGCGPGHLVNAMLKAGFGRARGFDSFAPAVETARRIGMLSESVIRLSEPTNLLEELASCDEEVVSMMCVLVHLESPLAALTAMRENPNVRYTFQKLPLWSFATILEAATPGLNARVLGASHTHVFTHESLEWLERELGMTRVASWSFGADFLDLQRKILLQMISNGSSPELVSRAKTELTSVANDFQLVCDTKKLASEIHLVWEFD